MSITLNRVPHKNPRIDALTSAERLRWVLEFIRRDLDALPSESLETLGDDLQHATAPWWVAASWVEGKVRECTDMPAADVYALQQEIREGIHAIMGQSITVSEFTKLGMGLARPPGWVLPVAATHLLRVVDHRGDFFQIYCVDEKTTERIAILTGVANLIVTCGARLCICPVCDTLFLRRYRQAYCTVKCSNKVRNRRRKNRQTHHTNGQLVTTHN